LTRRIFRPSGTKYLRKKRGVAWSDIIQAPTGIAAMFNRKFRLRLALVPAYAVVGFVLLCWGDSGDTFCGDAGRPSVPLATMRFALLATSLDTVVSLLAGLFRPEKKVPFRLAKKPLLEALAVGVTLYFAQSFLFEGGEINHPLKGTVLDVSCLLTEGYGMFYPVLVVPAFALLTFARENLFDWLSRKVPD
jgi:hypothetical protein